MLSEHDIDQELKAALSVSPSADFEARVLQRIEARAERRPWWWPSYAVAAAAAALVLVAGLAFLSRDDGAEPVPVAHLASPVPVPSSSRETRTLPESPAPATDASEPGSGTVAAHRAQPTHGRAGPPPAVDVIVPAEHVAALQRLVEGIHNGTLDIPPATPAEVPVGESVDPDAPAVEALVVNPIPVPAAGAQPGGLSPVMRGF